VKNDPIDAVGDAGPAGAKEIAQSTQTKSDATANGLSHFKPLSSRDLFGPNSEICIEHEGSMYRLRITRQGKLILNK